VIVIAGLEFSLFVMAGLVPAIYVFGRARDKDVDAQARA
jgi:hypothetical protein